MGSSILDGRPTPVAAVARYPECKMVVTCSGCAHVGRLGIVRMVQRHRLPKTVAFHELEARLRCLSCGAAGRVTAVEGWRRGE